MVASSPPQQSREVKATSGRAGFRRYTRQGEPERTAYVQAGRPGRPALRDVCITQEDLNPGGRCRDEASEAARNLATDSMESGFLQ